MIKSLTHPASVGKLFFSLLVLVQLYSLNGWSQSSSVRFSHLSIEQGLSQNSVQTILEDHLGYLWIGTMDGLNRYDGYKFFTFNHSPWDSTSLGHNNVMQIAEDGQGTLWMLTANGISRLRFADQEIGKFDNFDIPGVSALMVDKTSQVWVGGTGLMKFSRKSNTFVSMDSIYPELRNIAVNAILRDQRNTLWIGSIHDGLFAISETEKDKYELKQYQHDPGDPGSISHNFIKSLFEDSRGNLWIGASGGGLNSFRAETGTFEKPFHALLSGKSLQSAAVTAIIEDRNRRLWMGVAQWGLIHFDPETGDAEVYSHNPANPNSLSHNSVMSLAQDHSGMLWIGANGGGLNRFDPGQLRIRHHYNALENPESLDHNSVWSFYEDRLGNFWVGTNKGLSRMTTDAGGAVCFTTVPLPIGNTVPPFIANRDNTRRQEESSPSTPSSITVRAILEDRYGGFWIGSQNNGLFEYDPLEKSSIQYRLLEDDSNSISSDNVYALLEDRSGDLWIGVNGRGGLSRLIRKPDGSKQFQRYPAVEKKGGWVLCLYEDRQGLLWLGTWDHGLIKYEQATGQFVPITTILEGGKRLGEYSVFSITADTSGTLWVGTYGVGLCRVSKMQQDTVYFKSYSEREGLPNNVIYGILPDELGNLWVSSNKGISRFNPQTEHFQNFTEADGLQGMEFNLGAAFRRRNGEMFFGGNNGFNAFYPSDLMNETPPKVVLTALKKFGKKAFFKTHTSELRAIDLSYKDDYIALEYVGLHYKHPKQNQYAYILEGFDREWHDVGNKREAIYTNLPPGEYTFRVKAANSDGIWGEPSIGLKITVKPPFWETWWFFLTCAVGLGLMILVWHQSRVRKALVLERTRITERDQERDRIRRDLHVEWGGKLSAVQHRMEKLIPMKQTSALLSHGQLMKAIVLLKELELLFREYLWVLDREQMTLFDLVAQLKEYGDTLFEDTEIALHIEGLTEISRDYLLPLLWRQHLVRIFKEALNNVFRHSGNCKNVTLKILLKDRWLEIILTDDGDGFDTEAISNGIGLEDMHDRAKKIGGKLGIHSTPGKGTEVRFRGIYPDA